MNRIICVFIWVLLLTVEVAFSQDETLDSSFGIKGIVLPVFEGLESENHFLVVQRDGKVLTGETVFAHGVSPQFYLIRYGFDGSRDVTFGTEGLVISNFPKATARLSAIEIQSDGKIIAVGKLSSEGGEASFLVRYKSDGTFDSGFGNNGMIIKSNATIHSFALQTDGKIIVAESANDSNGLGFISQLIRYDSSGTLDANFGVNGAVSTKFKGKIATQPDGKILFSKDILFVGKPSDFTLIRYLNNGMVDMIFGNNGTAIIDFENNDELKSVKIQPDGKIVVVGYSWYSVENTIDYSYHVLFRLFSNGNLDIDFGDAGKSKLMISSNALEIQPDGKIIVAGGTLPESDGPNQIALSRFLTDGSLDLNFGDSGIVTTALDELESIRGSASSVKFIPEGKIVVGGVFCEAFLSCHSHSFVLRYNSGFFTSPQFDFSQNNFLIYPNPVNQIVTLDFFLNQSEALTVYLYDSNGRKITTLLKDKKFEIGQNSQKLELPETLAKGLYFLDISNGDNRSNIKMLK